MGRTEEDTDSTRVEMVDLLEVLIGTKVTENLVVMVDNQSILREMLRKGLLVVLLITKLHLVLKPAREAYAFSTSRFTFTCLVVHICLHMTYTNVVLRNM